MVAVTSDCGWARVRNDYRSNEGIAGLLEGWDIDEVE